MIDKYQLADLVRRITTKHLQSTIDTEEISGGRVMDIKETGRLEFCVRMVDPTGPSRWFYVKVTEPQ